MSSAIGWAGIAAVAAVAGTAYSVYNGEQQNKAQKNAAMQAKQNADKQAALADQDMNKANQKRPDTSSALAAAQQAGKAGVSGTMLTGSSGVDPTTLQLGKNTLLGG